MLAVHRTQMRAQSARVGSFTAGESFRRKLAEAGVEVVTAASEDPRAAVAQAVMAATR